MSGSPFPGMDPYLEGDLWTAFHADFAHQIQAQLMPRLRPKYVALEVPVISSPAAEALNPLPEEVPVHTVEIRDVAERRLVTVVEILSPVNKQGDGLREYVDKRTLILQTQTHLLEIDLLRGGARIPLIGELPSAPYYVFLSRFTHRPRTSVWAVGLRDRLPVVPVPLLPPDPDVPLDLQAAVNACFELVGYARLLDYTQAPPKLSADDLAWLRAQIEAVRST